MNARDFKDPVALWAGVRKLAAAKSVPLSDLCPAEWLKAQRIVRPQRIAHTHDGIRYVLLEGALDEFAVSTQGREAFIRAIGPGLLPQSGQGQYWRATEAGVLVGVHGNHADAVFRLWERVVRQEESDFLRRALADWAADSLEERARAHYLCFTEFRQGKVSRMARDLGCSREHMTRVLRAVGGPVGRDTRKAELAENSTTNADGEADHV